MSTELNIVLEVEQHECLYNYKLPEYSRKDVTEGVWSEIARKLEMSVNEAKEKWRNIRSSFIRSLKTTRGSKPRKAYYLRDHLHFVLPYVKTINSSESPGKGTLQTAKRLPQTHDDIHYDPNEESKVDIDTIQNVDAANASSCDQVVEPQTQLWEKRQLQMSETEIPTTTRHKRKRKIPELDKAFAEYLMNKNKKRRTDENNPMRLFLLSILPEFDSMTETQIRKFKIKVLMLIDEMKSSPSEASTNPLLV